MQNERLVVEGAGAVGVAALLSARLDVQGKRVAVVLSGANIDQGTLSELSKRLYQNPNG